MIENLLVLEKVEKKEPAKATPHKFTNQDYSIIVGENVNVLSVKNSELNFSRPKFTFNVEKVTVGEYFTFKNVAAAKSSQGPKIGYSFYLGIKVYEGITV